eukprot:CAMPEP_0196573982 /NCGR_PEP_ID=MMETSP1081-20130531/3787_1 /TAXON_ID=36882 /ORGANISM="Pyramimonas amylifera, Strain CCMP720" /LENGTH=59 /DNA_ID=CAMNT_0041891863 /DNA_START=125 /DNA_END=304 /DNA_ORIENTATION=+
MALEVGSVLDTAQNLVKRVPTIVLQNSKVVFHYGFIPLIIFLGMNTEPKPSIAELLRPM